MEVIRGSLGDAVRDFWGKSVFTSLGRVRGGCINEAYRIEVEKGKTIFVKENGLQKPDLFLREAEGLELLRFDGGPPVPAVYGVVLSETRQYLLLEDLPRKPTAPGAQRRFGRRLAELHLHSTAGFAGGKKDNYIGDTVQKNQTSVSWVDFFRVQRLGFQRDLALRSGRLPSRFSARLALVMDRLDRWLPAHPSFSLLHGDLWGGNVLYSGEGYLIDPAVYYGDREADIAMTELFGGFSRGFYQGYTEVYPFYPGYRERKGLYNLYHMLNHLNLFGASYLSSVDSLLSLYG